MADYEVTFIHNGTQRQARISGYGFRDAYECLQSLKANGVISDEIVCEINDPDIDIKKARELAHESNR